MTFSTLSKTLAAVSVALLCSCAAPQGPHNFRPPSVVPVKEKVVEAQTHVKSAQSAAKRIAAATTEPCKTAEWQAAYDDLTKELNDAYLALSVANERADTLQKQNDTLATEANAVDDKRIAAEKREKVVLGKYHRVKSYLAAIAAAAVALLLWQFKSILSFLGPYSVLAFIATPAAAAALVFLLL